MRALYFILISFFWGGSFLAINASIRTFSPFLGATLRVFIAFVCIGTYIIIRKIKLPPKKLILETMLNGMVGVGIPWALLFWGEQYVEPALCSIINATVPIFTLLFAAFLMRKYHDKMTWDKWIGTLLGFGGIAVIFVPFVSKDSTESLYGLIAVIGMAVGYAIGIAWLKRLSHYINTSASVFCSMSGALVFLIPLTIIYGQYKPLIVGDELLLSTLAILYLGVFSTFLAFVFFFKLIKEGGSVQAAAVTYMVPVISISLDWLILDKWVGVHSLFGALLVFTSLRLINRTKIKPV